MVAIGSKVKYIISLGTKPIVPNVVGMTASDANTAIVDANLVVGTVTTKYSNTVDAGKVISQSPAAGRAVAIGSKVKYIISLGKKPIVPNVVGMVAPDANTAIVDANLVVGTVTTKYSNTVDAGKVISQSPAAGKAVAIGSKVKYVISLGKME
jgi:serine/threonine-protein kinase